MAAEHQASRRQLDERLARLHQALIILRQPPIPRDPGKRTLNYPSARLHGEAARPGLALHGLALPAVAL